VESIFVYHFAAIVLALSEEANLDALNFLLALNLIRSTKLHFSKEPAFCQKRVLAVQLSCLSSLKT
jgi:hypothetical protein